MKTFGKHKVCFATDYPLLPFDRVIAEVDALELSRRSAAALPARQRAARASRS